MELQFQSIFQHLEPYRAALDFGGLTEENGQQYTPEPGQPGRRLLVTDVGFVSEYPDSPFGAGNVFDFLAAHLGGYEQTVQHVLRHYPHIGQNPSGQSLESFCSGFTKELQLGRDIFRSWTDLRHNLQADHAWAAPARMWLRKRELQAEAVWTMLYAAQGSELNRLLHDEECNPDRCYLVFPYLANPHTLACVRVLDTLTEEPLKTYDIRPTQFAYFGLSGIPSQASMVCSTPDDALALQQQYHALSYFQQRAGHVGHFPGKPLNPYRPCLGCYLQEGAEDFPLLTQVRNTFQQFSVSSRAMVNLPAAFSRRVAWHTYLQTRLQRLINTGQKADILSMFDTIKLDVEAVRHLTGCLDYSHQNELLEQLKQKADRRQTYQMGNVSVVETPCGYVAQATKGGHESLFTNFVLRIDRNLWFEPEEMYHSGRVLTGQRDYPVCFSQKVAQRFRDVESACRAAVHKQDSPKGEPTLPGVVTPTMLDSTYGRRLVEVLNSQIARAQTVIGISRLGWDVHGQTFTTPTWRARVSGIEPTSKVLHPQRSLLNDYYDVRDYATNENDATIGPSLRTLLAALAAVTVRSLLNRDCPPVPVMESLNSKKALHFMFLALGQRHPIEVNPNRRNGRVIFEPQGLQRYPLYATTVNPAAVAELHYPILLLSSAGLGCRQVVDETLGGHFYTLVYRCLTKLTSSVIRDSRQAVEITLQEKPNLVQMVNEGKQLLMHYTGLADFPIFDEKLGHFYQALSEIPLAKVGDFFRFDLSEQTITIDCRNIKSVFRREIYQDLVKLEIPVQMDGSGHCLIAPVDQVSPLLDIFYGETVQLFHQAEPTKQKPLIKPAVPTGVVTRLTVG